jgi:hypothetical protein
MSSGTDWGLAAGAGSVVIPTLAGTLAAATTAFRLVIR